MDKIRDILPHSTYGQINTDKNRPGSTVDDICQHSVEVLISETCEFRGLWSWSKALGEEHTTCYFVRQYNLQHVLTLYL